MLANKGYDGDAIRDEIRARAGKPEIPSNNKSSRRVQHAVDRVLYATRKRIERFFNRLKYSRRVATRYDHTPSSFLGFAKLATIKQWIGFVHATSASSNLSLMPAAGQPNALCKDRHLAG
jgi:transposase